MDYLEDRVAALWHDLRAASLEPLDLSEIAALFTSVTRAAYSREVARRLGPAHAVVTLAARVVGDGYAAPWLTPERASELVVVAGYLATPSLCEEWFGYSLSRAESEAFSELARAELEAWRTE